MFYSFTLTWVSVLNIKQAGTLLLYMVLRHKSLTPRLKSDTGYGTI